MKLQHDIMYHMNDAGISIKVGKIFKKHFMRMIRKSSHFYSAFLESVKDYEMHYVRSQQTSVSKSNPRQHLFL